MSAMTAGRASPGIAPRGRVIQENDPMHAFLAPMTLFLAVVLAVSAHWLWPRGGSWSPDAA